MKLLTIILMLLLLIPSTLAINSGDKILAGGKTITLLSIANDRVRVSVDGQADVIQQYQQKEINGVSIYVRKIISVTSPNSGKSSAELIIGTDDKTELIYVPYKEPEIQKPQTTETPKPAEQQIEPESETPQIFLQPQKSKTFNLINFLKSIVDKLKFY